MGKRGSGSFESVVPADLSTPSNGGSSCGLVHESDELHAECFCRWSAGVRGGSRGEPRPDHRTLGTLHPHAAVDTQATRDEEVERQGETWTRSRSKKTRLTPTTTETCPLKPPHPQSSTSLNPPRPRPTTSPSLPRHTVGSHSSKRLTTGYSLAMMSKFWFVAACILLGTEASRLIIIMTDRRRAEDVCRIQLPLHYLCYQSRRTYSYLQARL